jgi:hypothetical protein
MRCSDAAGGVERGEAVDAVRQVRGREVRVPVALADRAALRERHVQQVDGFLVADRVRLVARLRPPEKSVKANGW